MELLVLRQDVKTCGVRAARDILCGNCGVQYIVVDCVPRTKSDWERIALPFGGGPARWDTPLSFESASCSDSSVLQRLLRPVHPRPLPPGAASPWSPQNLPYPYICSYPRHSTCSSRRQRTCSTRSALDISVLISLSGSRKLIFSYIILTLHPFK